MNNKIKNILVAHSPDADDIFMYYAVKFGWIKTQNSKFKNIALDIETLNNASLEGKYDICAISFALYPFIKDEYALLKTAVSFGYKYGPKIIKKKNTTLKRNFTIALSGKYTTNALLFKIRYPDAKIKYMNFLKIEEAVLNGEVDAGVLIHESILTYDENLEIEGYIYDIWCDLVNDSLPLPLGGMCMRRSIPLLDAIKYEDILTKAVEIGFNNKKLLSKMLLERNLIRVDSETLDKYLDMYANQYSITMDNKQYEALDKLYKIGYDNNYFSEQIQIKNYLIPDNYKILREN